MLRTARSRETRAYTFIAWGAVALAAVLRAAGLARGELWFDEAYSALLSLQPLAGIAEELSHDSSPPLYYFSLRAWRVLFGGDPAALRALSALAGVVAVFLVIRLTRFLWNERTGCMAGALMAISPLHLYYSQEARPYSLFLAFALLALVGLARLSRSRSPLRNGGLYCTGVVLALYTHNYGVFLLVPLTIEVIRGRVRARVAAACVAIVAVAYLPWLPMLIHQLRSGSAAWVARIWQQTPPMLALPKSLAAFSIGGEIPLYVPVGSFPFAAWTHAAACTLFGLIALRAICLSGDSGATARQVALWLMLLLGTPYVLSFDYPIYVVGRYDLIALPAFLALAASGWSSLRGRTSLTAGGLLVLLGTLSAAAYYTRPPLHGAQRQAATISAQSGTHDAVLAMGFTRNPLEYYVRTLGGSPVVFFSFPSSLGVHRGWIDERQFDDRAAVAADAERVVESLAIRQRPGDRLWVAHSGVLADAATLMLAVLNRTFAPVACPAAAEAIGLSCWSKRAAAIARR